MPQKTVTDGLNLCHTAPQACPAHENTSPRCSLEVLGTSYPLVLQDRPITRGTSVQR